MFTLAIQLAAAISAPPPIQNAHPATPEAVVRALYDRVTWKPPQTPNWDSVRAVFHKEAVFSLRLGRGDIRVMDLDGFIREWIDYAKLEPVVKNGFQEKIVRLKATEYGEIANVYVLYEAMIPGYMKAPQQGIDICHLVKTGGKWTIVSIVNELVDKGKPLPPDLR
ncbi:MAG: hypothetical protein HONBIEJF_01511 [Fimbriimonadaceae bacterium]|nr:hypothetical protein [Fimbriimonadaceae bacterium]